MGSIAEEGRAEGVGEGFGGEEGWEDEASLIVGGKEL